ncbi:hypothetical protein FIV42_15590 [Persicimonas caeni]|uniref:DUF2397 family protein n=1 Tax=Persicimonas caeni TaxID=2292766 RepID=A0A4Y6PUU4_PERCE|nr:hypothetical protein [Persicimonas caeni]QDG52114.1 hypothetical protein FIV42_15590 [Persicimonas caeni]QED33335.1 hypothetical protein FRD00_15585 [Persicimonas caeni]
MTVSPEDFFRFASKYPRLLVALFERSRAIDEVDLRALIERHASQAAPSLETIYTQLFDYGFLQEAPGADLIFELSGPVRSLLAWLLKRQQLATAEVVMGYVKRLGQLTAEIDQALDSGRAHALSQPIEEADHTLDSIRDMAEANFEAITTQASNLRSQRDQIRARERFEIVNRVWEQVLVPLGQLIEVGGALDVSLNKLAGVLARAPELSGLPRPTRRALQRTGARLVRTRRIAGDRHREAIAEIAPLYKRLRADSRLLDGASALLRRLWAQGASGLDVDERLALVSWRPYGLVSDDRLLARFVSLQGYEPEEEVEIAAAPPPVEHRFLLREEVADALAASGTIDDVLAFMSRHWPDHGLAELLRAYGWVYRGDFGSVDVPEDAGERQYRVGDTTVTAWPLRYQAEHLPTGGAV